MDATTCDDQNFFQERIRKRLNTDASEHSTQTGNRTYS